MATMRQNFLPRVRSAIVAIRVGLVGALRHVPSSCSAAIFANRQRDAAFKDGLWSWLAPDWARVTVQCMSHSVAVSPGQIIEWRMDVGSHRDVWGGAVLIVNATFKRNARAIGR